MNINKLSQDEIDQLNFDGDLSAPSYNDADIHGNVSSQQPGGAVALCICDTLENNNTSWYGYGAGSTGPSNYAVGGAGAYQSPNVQVAAGGGGASNTWQGGIVAAIVF
jgi:hypothetical protein